MIAIRTFSALNLNSGFWASTCGHVRTTPPTLVACYALQAFHVSFSQNRRVYPRFMSTSIRIYSGWADSITPPKEDVATTSTKIQPLRWAPQPVGMIIVKSASTDRIVGGLDVGKNLEIFAVLCSHFSSNSERNFPLFAVGYEDRHAEIGGAGILEDSGSFELVGVAEYGDTNNDHTVVLKIGLGFPDYYVSFNRDIGIHSDTSEYSDQVLVHTTIIGLDPAGYTDLRAALSAGDTFEIPGGEIEVVSIDTSSTPGVAEVNVNRVVPSGKLDVFFLIDDTGSFSNDIMEFQGIIDDVILDIQNEGDDVHFGLAIFRDYDVDDYGSSGDFPYQLLVAIPSDEAATDGSQEVINMAQTLIPEGGGDARESQLTALFQAVTGDGQLPYVAAGQGANFRMDAAKFIILWTDSGFHDSGVEEDYPGPSYGDVLDELQNAGVPFRQRRNLMGSASSVRVVGIARPGEDTFDEAVDYLRDLATDTGAVAPEGGVDCSGNGS